MSAARQAGPWLFSAFVSGGVHVGAVAVLLAALPPLEAPASPTQFVLASLEAPPQIEVEAVTANVVAPAVAIATEPAAARAQAIAPESLQPTRVEGVAGLTPQTQTLSATPAVGVTAAAVAIAGQTAITTPQARAERLQPAADTPVPVTTTAAAEGAMGASTIVPTTSALAAMAVAPAAEAQIARPATGTVVPTVVAIDGQAGITAPVSQAVSLQPAIGASLPVATQAAAAGATGTSISVQTGSALAPMGSTATAEALAGSPITGTAVPTNGAASQVVTKATVTAAVPPDAAAAMTTVPTVQSIASVPGAQAQRPAAAVAAPVEAGSVGVPATTGAQAVPIVVGAQAAGSGSLAPAGAGPVAVTAALSTSGTTLAPLPPDTEVIAGLDTLDDYLARYDGGDCFAVLPERPDDGTVALTAFAGSPAAAGAFLEALARDFGALVPVEARPVSAEQCGALAFVRSNALYPGFDLGLALDADAIAVGAPLTGEVLRMTGTWLTLAVIDDEGRVSSLEPYLQLDDGAIRFEAPVVPTGQAAGRTQLLLAIATAEQLVAEPHDGDSAEAFLAALEAELSERGIAAELAVSAFTVR